MSKTQIGGKDRDLEEVPVSFRAQSGTEYVTALQVDNDILWKLADVELEPPLQSFDWWILKVRMCWDLSFLLWQGSPSLLFPITEMDVTQEVFLGTVYFAPLSSRLFRSPAGEKPVVHGYRSFPVLVIRECIPRGEGEVQKNSASTTSSSLTVLWKSVLCGCCCFHVYSRGHRDLGEADRCQSGLVRSLSGDGTCRAC